MTLRRCLHLLIAFASAFGSACEKLDFFLYESDPATLSDYDFTSEELDGIPVERITSEKIPSRQNGKEIHVIYVERDASKLDPRIDPDAGVSVIFSHGNSGNMRRYLYRVGYFEEMGFNVLMYDYRGYGASDGEATERHVYEDAETAYDYLASKPGVGRILSVGYSMGGAPAIWLCSPESGRKPFACFTESAFASVEQLIRDGTGYDFVGSWFLDTRFDNASRIRSVAIPFLLMHGTRDQRVDYHNAEILWRAVEGNNPQNRFWPAESGHNNVPVPSYDGSGEPREWSHPTELPPGLREEFDDYRARVVHFAADALEAEGRAVAPENQL